MKDYKKPELPPSTVSAFHPELFADEQAHQTHIFPKVSIIIPTQNSSLLIGLTLENVLAQEYPDFEVLIIDANSRDRTLQVVRSFFDPRIRVVSVTTYNRYEMLNKGLSLAHGTYVNFLFPGDFYVHSRTLSHAMKQALEHSSPHLVYGGCLLRDGRSEVKMLFRPFNDAILKKGQQPTTLQSCWFRNDIFGVLGKFSTAYTLRGAFDLLCRFHLHPEFKSVSTTRVLTDYDLRGVTRRMVVQHFLDTWRILYRYFGLLTVMRWVVFQKDTSRFLKLWKRSLSMAFFEQRQG